MFRLEEIKAFFAAGIVLLFHFGAPAHSADGTSFSLPDGFLPMASNDPPIHETYSMSLEDIYHVQVISIDRRGIPEAADFIKEKGEIMAGPLAAGYVAAEVQAIKLMLGKKRPGWSVEYNTGPIGTDAFPHRLCDGFEWNADISPDGSDPELLPWIMHGKTISCFFLGESGAWMTSATVSENIHPSRGHSLSQEFEAVSTRVLGSLRY